MPRTRHSPTENGRFDRAVVYFNAGAFFEAHEDWEDLWHEAEGAERRWLQGLIQIAAAFVHFERGFFARGFVQLIRDGSAKLAGYDGDDWGLDLEDLEARLRPWRRHAERVAAGADLPSEAPPLPRLHYRPGVVPDPLLPGEPPPGP
jgi:hypothetical protein